MYARIGTIFVTLVAVVIAGCGETKKSTGPKVKTRVTINKKTQNVLKLEDALQQGGQLAETTIPVADPLTQSAAAYRTSVGKIGGMAVEQAIAVRNAQNVMQDPKPLTYDEFMTEIIKKGQADGIHLAMLPYYQEYAWDEKNQKLVVVEFPAKKEQLQKQEDEERGIR